MINKHLLQKQTQPEWMQSRGRGANFCFCLAQAWLLSLHKYLDFVLSAYLFHILYSDYPVTTHPLLSFSSLPALIS